MFIKIIRKHLHGENMNEIIIRIKQKCLNLMKRYLPKQFVKYRYKRVTGKKLNLKRPKGFNEKLLWLLLYWKKPLVVQCADKYEVRKYVEEKGVMEIMPELYGVYTDVNEIEWEKFPKKFAIKCTHGCKYNIICFDKDELNIIQSEELLDKWMHSTFGLSTFEPHYAKTKPRIIAEEFIETTTEDELPEDYKLYCFNGEPKCILACFGRGDDVVYEFYDMEWNVLQINKKTNQQRATKPACLDEMIKYAKILSKDIPFVRVDLYDSFGKPILGEMTFTPGYAMDNNYTEEGSLWLGSMLELPEKYEGDYN